MRWATGTSVLLHGIRYRKREKQGEAVAIRGLRPADLQAIHEAVLAGESSPGGRQIEELIQLGQRVGHAQEVAAVFFHPLRAGVLAPSQARDTAETGRVFALDQDRDAVKAENQTTAPAARISGYRDRASGTRGHGKPNSDPPSPQVQVGNAGSTQHSAFSKIPVIWPDCRALIAECWLLPSTRMFA
jgi:hypothetical protein